MDMQGSWKINLCRSSIWAALILLLTLKPFVVSGGIERGQREAGGGVARSPTSAELAQRLIGTAVSRDPADTYAVIEDVGSKLQWLYHEGDTIGDILIKEIQPGQIIIDRGRGEEVVKLRRSQVMEGTSPARVSSATVRLTIPSPDKKSGPRDRNYLIDSGEVAIALADPARLQQNADLQPGMLFSQRRGVRINALTVESMLPAMGLRKGDLLLGVNNQVINGPEDAVALLQTMFEDGSEAELKVRRRARTYRIHLQDLQVK